MRRIGSGLFGIVMALALTACGTLDRPTGPLRITDGTLVKAEDPRIRSNDQARLQAFTQEIAGRFGPIIPQPSWPCRAAGPTAPMAPAC